jgi:hypothetical protein
MCRPQQAAWILGGVKTSTPSPSSPPMNTPTPTCTTAFQYAVSTVQSPSCDALMPFQPFSYVVEKSRPPPAPNWLPLPPPASNWHGWISLYNIWIHRLILRRGNILVVIVYHIFSILLSNLVWISMGNILSLRKTIDFINGAITLQYSLGTILVYSLVLSCLFRSLDTIHFPVEYLVCLPSKSLVP